MSKTRRPYPAAFREQIVGLARAGRTPCELSRESDQGSQYTILAFGGRCKEMGVRPSIGTVGDAYDNAMAESFFATLECELIARRTWKSKGEAKTAVFTWIEGWYNPRRRHSALDHQSPVNFERRRKEQESDVPASRPEHGLHTASVGSSQAPTDAMHNPAEQSIDASKSSQKPSVETG